MFKKLLNCIVSHIDHYNLHAEHYFGAIEHTYRKQLVWLKLCLLFLD